MLAVVGCREDVADAGDLDDGAVEAHALAEDLERADDPSVIDGHEAEIVAERRIVVEVAREKCAVVQPVRQQVEDGVTFMRCDGADVDVGHG